MEQWVAKELELNQRHECLLLRREAILRGTETYYDAQQARAATFISDFAKAKERNDSLLTDLDQYKQDLRAEITSQGTPRFNTLKNNYWAMVKNVFPVWLEEQRDYERRVRSPRSASPHSTAATPRSGRQYPGMETPRSSRVPGDTTIPPLDLGFTMTEEGPLTTDRSRKSSHRSHSVPAPDSKSGSRPAGGILRSKTPDGTSHSSKRDAMIIEAEDVPESLANTGETISESQNGTRRVTYQEPISKELGAKSKKAKAKKVKKPKKSK